MFTFIFGVMIIFIILAFEILRFVLKLFGIEIPSLFSYKTRRMTQEEEEWYFMQQYREENKNKK